MKTAISYKKKACRVKLGSLRYLFEVKSGQVFFEFFPVITNEWGVRRRFRISLLVQILRYLFYGARKLELKMMEDFIGCFGPELVFAGEKIFLVFSNHSYGVVEEKAGGEGKRGQKDLFESRVPRK